MKSFLRRFYGIAFCYFLAANFTVAADTNSPPRLTVELRDGSRVVGASVENYFKFHTVLLGEIKLDVKDIRSVECVSSNLAKLSTANGDSLTVSFVDSEFAVKTSFGKVNLAVDSVRKFSVAAGGTGMHPPGMVALWSGEGNANDSAGGNNGQLVNGVGFAPGKVGQAFSLNGDTGSGYVQVPDVPDLHFTDAMTVEAWVNLRTFSGANSREIVSKVGGPNLNQGSFTFAIDSSTRKAYFIVCGISGVNGTVYSSTTIPVNQWVHLAGAYDGSAIKIYVNGQLDATTPWNQPVFPGNNPLVIGCTLQNYSHATSFFNGLIDEVGLFNRALSASEIQTICTEQNNGEPLPPPTPSPSMMPFNGINGSFRQGGFGGSTD